MGGTFCGVDIHLLFLCGLGLGLLGGLEELLVQAFETGLFDGREDAGAQLGAVRLLDGGAQTLGHFAGGAGGGGGGGRVGRRGGCGRWW